MKFISTFVMTKHLVISTISTISLEKITLHAVRHAPDGSSYVIFKPFSFCIQFW